MSDTRSTPSNGTTPAARKWHTKSRTGCQSCKARKVKCDEHHPSCRNCIKRGIKCDFLKSEASSPASSISAPPSTLELELLHNFTISTASTLTTDPQVRDLWRILIPQIGFTTRYILDGILALSALHMARYDPVRRDLFLSQATHYHTASLKEALPLIPSITPQNSSHLFLFGVLTLFTNLASPIKEDDMLLVGNGFIPEWLFLFRGIDTLIQAEEEAIESTAVSLIFRSTDPSGDFWSSHTPAPNKVLDALEAGIRIRTATAKDRQDSLLQAVECLRRSYTFLDSSNRFADEDKLRGFYQWLCEVSDGYLKLLREADSEALCVMAFFAVLLRDLEKYWWIEGWGVHLIKRIYVMLDEEYRLCIRWPIEEIGWIPPSRMI